MYEEGEQVVQGKGKRFCKDVQNIGELKERRQVSKGRKMGFSKVRTE